MCTNDKAEDTTEMIINSYREKGVYTPTSRTKVNTMICKSKNATNVLKYFQ